MPPEDVRVKRTKHVVWSNEDFTQRSARLILLAALLENMWYHLRRILFLPEAEYVGWASLIRRSPLFEHFNYSIFDTWLFTKLWCFNMYAADFETGFCGNG
jgi:hypothetical protein